MFVRRTRIGGHEIIGQVLAFSGSAAGLQETLPKRQQIPARFAHQRQDLGRGMLGRDFQLPGNMRACQCVDIGLAGAPVGHRQIAAQSRGDKHAAHSRQSPQRFQ